MFVFRNLGHVLSNGDLSSRSAVEWSVELLKVSFLADIRRKKDWARRGLRNDSTLEICTNDEE
jgi:hypothetical protein